MDTITNASIQRAFHKTIEDNPIEDGKLVLIQKEHYDRVLQFLRDDFIPTEYVSQAVEWKWNPELEAMFVSALQRNISIMLLDKENDDVMGLRLMAVSKPGEEFTEEQFQEKVMKKVVGLWNLGDLRTNFFERYNTKEAIHFFGLGVGIKYRKRGFGTLLVDMSLKFLKNLEISPLYVKAEASSLFSMRIFEKLGFELLAEVKYDEYRKDGNIVIKSTGGNTGMKTYGKLI